MEQVFDLVMCFLRGADRVYHRGYTFAAHSYKANSHSEDMDQSLAADTNHNLYFDRSYLAATFILNKFKNTSSLP